MRYDSRLNRSNPRGGFTLVEVMIGALLVMVLALAVGLAMYRTCQTTARVRLAVTTVQRRNDLVRRVAADLADLQSVLNFASNTVTFTTTASGTEETIRYLWQSAERELWRCENGTVWRLLAEDIYHFELQPDSFTDEGGTVRLRGVTIVIQFGPDASGRFERYVEILNQPGWK